MGKISKNTEENKKRRSEFIELEKAFKLATKRDKTGKINWDVYLKLQQREMKLFKKS